MSGPLGLWTDGVAATHVPADDRGLQYGDGLFETLLIRNGAPRFLEAHIARLASGCGRLGIDPGLATLRACLSRAVASAPALAILKVVVTRGSAARRGYAPPVVHSPRRIVSLWPAADTGALGAGVTLGIARTCASTNPSLAGLKHLNRLDNVLAAAEIAGDDFDAVMFDAAGTVVSGTACNVFVARAGRIFTPPLDTAGVAGVMRGIVLREATALDLTVEARVLTSADLAAADEMFVTNARIGVVPVLRVGEHSFRMSDLAQKLRAHIEKLDA
jgi:4-amino-4-deoxychorismate lyase